MFRAIRSCGARGHWAEIGESATDGLLDSSVDMIDGEVRVGFYLTEDPSLAGQYAGSIGQHHYGTLEKSFQREDLRPLAAERGG
jgi:hypothetical protein